MGASRFIDTQIDDAKNGDGPFIKSNNAMVDAALPNEFGSNEFGPVELAVIPGEQPKRGKLFVVDACSKVFGKAGVEQLPKWLAHIVVDAKLFDLLNANVVGVGHGSCHRA